jgi:hypothetical protein
MPAADTLDREARRAAQRAARANWKPTAETTVTAADVTVGDFIVRVPSQNGVRGLKVESTVSAATPEWNTWRQGRMPVEGRTFAFRALANPIATPTFTVPASFKVVVRRTVEA